MPIPLPVVLHPRQAQVERDARSVNSGLPATVVPDGWGVQIHFVGDAPDQVERIADGGFGFVRSDLRWEDVERSPGAYRFDTYDDLVRQLASHGIRAVFILDFNNTLYDPDLQTMYAAADRDAFARFAAAAAGHFKGKHVVFELWNEPNSAAFWKPGKNAADYAAMANEAADAIHSADPNSTVIGPAILGYAPDFLRDVFARGLLDHVDAVSLHPYADQPPETRVQTYHQLRGLIREYSKGRAIPIVCSEWGYPDLPGEYTQQMQAAWMARAYLVDLASGIDLTIWYDWRDDGTHPTYSEENYGTLLYNGDVKPAFAEAQSLIKSLRGFRFVRRLDRGDAGKWSLLFQSGSRFARVDWDASQDTKVTAAMPIVTLIGHS